MMPTKAELEAKIHRLEMVIDSLTESEGALFHDDRLIANREAKAIRQETPAQSYAANRANGGRL